MENNKRLALGIDTGGTYTDAVLLDIEKGDVFASAKAPTTYDDLAVGIAEAIAALSPFDASAVELVSLSTTLATNAIVEGRGCSVCLLLLGYDAALLHNRGFMAELGTDDVVFVRGGHDVEGNEVDPLDEKAIEQVAYDRVGKVAAFAVSGYFSVRNPTHELRAKARLEEITGLPVTCGHELSSRLHSIKRATTAALNARLIPLLRDLIVAVRAALHRRGISAPLMVVKGDGSLVAAEVALERPVETILSGPAASAVGGYYLSGKNDVVVVDMGGTTTDIAVLVKGRPRLNPEGARVGRWRTMVEAVDVRTVALGGDSHVYFDRENRLQIGPRRVIALSRLATAHGEVLDILRQQAHSRRLHPEAGVFLCKARTLPAEIPEFLEPLQNGPIAYESVLSATGYPFGVRKQVDSWEMEGAIIRAAFTPTDALHVLGTFRPWSVEAARLGAIILARRIGIAPEEFCRRVVHGASERAALEIVAKAIDDAIGLSDWSGDAIAQYLVGQAINHHSEDPLLAYDLRIRCPLVAIGAPVAAYFPWVAEHLHAELIIPEHADVANAVGAVAGSIVQRVPILVLPIPEGGFRVHSARGIRDHLSLEDAVADAETEARALAEERARHAGAHAIRVHVERHDELASAAEWAEAIYLGTRVLAIAVGRPGVR